MTASVGFDPQHGARIDSIADSSGFEWLWSRPDPRRYLVHPGDAFVDVGGAEECFPTISGTPDHGEVWSQPWERREDVVRVTTRSGELQRRMTVDGDRIEFRYTLTAAPGMQFVWALHALVRPDPGMRLSVPGQPIVRCWSDGDDRPAVETRWPTPDIGRDLEELPGDDDGTARFVAVSGCGELSLSAPDGHRMRFRLDAPGQVHGIGIWRNLNGYPADDAPYRSFGIEPMLGTHHHLGHASPAEAAVVPAGGTAEWRVAIDLYAPGRD